jgi:hypothetical protein
MGEKAEVIPEGEKRILMDPQFPVIIKVGQNSSVLTEQSMDITDKIVGITVEPVVVVIPALV